MRLLKHESVQSSVEGFYTEEKIKNIFESANDCMIFLDRSGRILDVNGKAVQVFGGSKKELLGKHFTRVGVVSLRDIPMLMTSFAKILAGKKTTLNICIKNKKGQEIFLECSNSLMKIDDKLAGILVVARDVTERKQAEEALKESEERLRQLIEYAPDAIYINNLKGNFIDGNKQAEKLTGYKRDELIGKNFLKIGLLPKRYLPKAMKALTKNLLRQKTGPDEFELMRKDGTRVNVEISTFPVKRRGKVEVIGIARDITERKRIEESLEKSEEKYRSIVELAPDSIMTFDLKGVITSCNTASTRMAGYSKDELVGKHFSKIGPIRARDIPKYLKMLPFTIRGKVPKPFEVTYHRKNGTLGFGEVHLSLMKERGKTIGIQAIMRDITERKKAEEALRQSEEKYRSLVMNIPVVAWTDDERENTVFISPGVEKVIGFTPDEIYQGGSRFWDKTIHPDDRERVKKVYDLLFAKNKAFDFEYRMQRKDGRWIWIRDRAVATYKKDGAMYADGVLLDITERKQMEKKLEEYSEQLEELVEKRTNQLKKTQEQLLKSERLAAIGEVAAMVGHDLRSPLTGIAGATYYLKTKFSPKMDKKTKEMLELIEKDIEYSNKIISSLLDYSREIRLELAETTPKSILKDALTLVKAPKNIRILDLTENEPKIEVDLQKIKRIFINIIKNAIDAMPEGGKLTITSKESNDNLEIAFTDTGTGIPKDILEKIWTPLFTTKAKGMGLGLSICKRTVEAHRGSISVESTVGKGTTFTVTLPTKPKIEGGEKTWVNVPESLLLTTTKA